MMIGMAISYQGQVHPISQYSPRASAMKPIVTMKGTRSLSLFWLYLSAEVRATRGAWNYARMCETVSERAEHACSCVDREQMQEA